MLPLAFLITLLLSSCVSELEPIVEPIVDDAWVQPYVLLDTAARTHVITGVYEVLEHPNFADFGDSVGIGLAPNGELIMTTISSTYYVNVYGGVRSDTGVFVGTWRDVRGSQTGSVRISIAPQEGGSYIAENGGPRMSITMRCEMTPGRSDRSDLLVLSKPEKSKDVKDRDSVYVIAHRGGGRNSERLGFSENSIPMMLEAYKLGATGIEIDVMATKDGVPIIFHDPTFTPRTVQGNYILGDVKNYTYQQIQDHVRLVNGEPIPTLGEALTAVARQGILDLVWLDVKDAGIVRRIVTVAQAIADSVKPRKRRIRLLVGVPTTEIRDSVLAIPFDERPDVEVLCELSVKDVADLRATVWAPRFTEGLQESTVLDLRSQGVDVFVWTVDDPVFMDNFLEPLYQDLPAYNGILTNYPTIGAARVYARMARLAK